MKRNSANGKPRLPRATLLAAAMLATGGAATTASAVPVEMTATYSCIYPLIGAQPLSANIMSDMPEEIGVGDPTGAFDLNVLATAMGDTWVGLNLVGAVSVGGDAVSESNLSGTNLNLDLSVPLEVPDQTVPDSPGDFNIEAFGQTPSLTFSSEQVGEVVITVGDLDMLLVARNEAGDPVFFPNSDPETGAFPVPCTLDPGSETVLHTFEVVEDEPPMFPEISVNPDELDFGNVQAGLTDSDTVTVANIGGAPLGVNAIDITGPDAGAFMQTNDCSVVNVGENCQVEVTFFAENEGARNAVLTIESDDPDNPSVQVPLSGTSVLEQFGEISVDPEEVNFGTIPVGDSADRNLTISNTGGAAVDIHEISIDGANAGDFFASHSCSLLIPDESCDVSLTFTAGAEGARNASLTIASDDPENPTLTVPLAGSGATPGGGVEITMDIEGETFVRKANGIVPITGNIEADLDLSTGLFTGDLNLDPTSGTFDILHLGSWVNAEADIRFEQTDEVSGHLTNDGNLTAEANMYIYMPKISVRLFGFRLTIGGGPNCRTIDPVSINLEGDDFAPLQGGDISGTYDLPALENCGGLEGILSLFMAGPNNTIDLTLTPDL